MPKSQELGSEFDLAVDLDPASLVQVLPYEVLEVIHSEGGGEGVIIRPSEWLGEGRRLSLDLVAEALKIRYRIEEAFNEDEPFRLLQTDPKEDLSGHLQELEEKMWSVAEYIAGGAGQAQRHGDEEQKAWGSEELAQFELTLAFIFALADRLERLRQIEAVVEETVAFLQDEGLVDQKEDRVQLTDRGEALLSARLGGELTVSERIREALAADDLSARVERLKELTRRLDSTVGRISNVQTSLTIAAASGANVEPDLVVRSIGHLTQFVMGIGGF